MIRTALVLAFAALSSFAAALGWDSPDFRTPSVRDLISAESAPKTPASAPAPAAPAKAVSCPDGVELNGRAMQVTLRISGQAAPVVLDLAYARCAEEFPRDEPPAPPYTVRTYKTEKGDSLSVYSSSDRPASTLSLRLADGASSATLMPILATADLASGRTLDLGEVLLVRLTKGGADGVVIHAAASIKSAPR